MDSFTHAIIPLKKGIMHGPYNSDTYCLAPMWIAPADCLCISGVLSYVIRTKGLCHTSKNPMPY